MILEVQQSEAPKASRIRVFKVPVEDSVFGVSSATHVLKPHSKSRRCSKNRNLQPQLTYYTTYIVFSLSPRKARARTNEEKIPARPRSMRVLLGLYQGFVRVLYRVYRSSF